MRKYIYMIILGCILIFSACSGWLDVEPSDRISEKNAFSSIAGFKQALNGIYVELNQRSLYGASLTCEFVEILAQRYAISEDATNNYLLTQYDYNGSDAKARISAIWEKAYNLIANTNLLLKNCEENRKVLPDDYYELVKGEALALRGMLHFDLLRLFGPVYAKDSLLFSIPYYKEFSLKVNPVFPANEIMDNVLYDLLAAEELLQNDPVIKYGPAGDRLDNFKSDRNLRLNYYAVQALLARVYLWRGDNAHAFEYAKKVIGVQEKWFSWVDPLKIAAGLTNPDRVFSTEVLFALQNLSRSSLFSNYFDATNLQVTELLGSRYDVMEYNFTTRRGDGSQADYRYKSQFAAGMTELGGVNFKVFNKYQGQDSLWSQMIPLIRISEMYLIASETAETYTDKAFYDNELRNHRGLNNLNPVYFAYPSFTREILDLEYYKEFWGEGQLWFYYKRTQKQYVYSPNESYEYAYGKDGSMLDTEYVLPIPDGETQYN